MKVLKTYKLYVGGKFPRSESGRYYEAKSDKGEHIANVCQSSRKDFRESVLSSRAALNGWANKTAYNRGQILYRIAEILEGRKAQFVDEMISQGATKQKSEKEVAVSIDRLVYYAGWCDKFQQVFSSVNPVSSSHFNFSICEPMGVVGAFAPLESSLVGLVSLVSSVIAGGNTCIVLASESHPLCSITFGEVLHSSDVPGGVVNILTGIRKELLPHFSTHMDVNAVIYCGDDPDDISLLRKNSTVNLKRAIVKKRIDWFSPESESPYFISDTQETKTTWHPIGV
jgi:acyl-CoA reductase-like NAD-dependent aldehyde dehydrogenase